MAGAAALFVSVQSDPLLLFIMQVALTLALTRVLGKLFSYLHQPQVIGEIVAGILLGPSVLGRIPGYASAVWPTAVPIGATGQPYNSTITFYVVANVGVILFMFLLGCELDQRLLARQWRRSAPIALSAIVFPFGVGAAASLWLEQVNKEGQPPTWQPPSSRAFILFTGAAMSFTAFPVLASLLSSAGLLAAPIGVQALSCAAIDDVLAWCVLALASSFAKSGNALLGLYTTLLAAAYVLFMLFALKPALGLLHNYLMKKNLTSSRYYLSFVFLLLLASAFTTEGLGIHCFFGGFVMGLIMPKEGGFANSLVERMELVVSEVLLPLFFANSGIRTDIGTLDSGRYWAITLAIIGIACFSKFTPTCFMSKLLTKRSWRFCITMGLLMNTRGLVEVIALNIGLTMGILSPRMFTMMILMAIVTTCITAPGVHILYRGRREELLGENDPELSGLPKCSASTACQATACQATACQATACQATACQATACQATACQAATLSECDRAGGGSGGIGGGQYGDSGMAAGDQVVPHGGSGSAGVRGGKDAAADAV